jgi:small acid-soluble spore protein H (minor)
MDIQRAQEIADSPVMAHVTLGGVPIYIQRVNEQTGTARIFPLDQPQKEEEVSVQNLIEE